MAREQDRGRADLDALFRIIGTELCWVGQWRRDLIDGDRPLHLIVAEMRRANEKWLVEGDILQRLEILSDGADRLERHLARPVARQAKRGDQRRKRNVHPPNVVYLDLHR
jgi:hypothetical protein